MGLFFVFLWCGRAWYFGQSARELQNFGGATFIV